MRSNITLRSSASFWPGSGLCPPLVCAFLLSSLSQAQSTRVNVDPRGDSAKKEDAIILSPFEVRTEQDKGFVASSSLAGGRLGSELKDTPVAYSVVTRDLIDALQL